MKIDYLVTKEKAIELLEQEQLAIMRRRDARNQKILEEFDDFSKNKIIDYDNTERRHWALSLLGMLIVLIFPPFWFFGDKITNFSDFKRLTYYTKETYAEVLRNQPWLRNRALQEKCDIISNKIATIEEFSEDDMVYLKLDN